MHAHHFGLAVAVTATIPTTIAAGAVDFESFDLAGMPFIDVADTLDFPGVAPGVDMTIVGGADLQIFDFLEWAGSDPGGNGQAMIDFDFDTEMNDAGTEFLFSSPIEEFSLEAGDFGGDPDGLLQITAFDSSGAIVAMDSVEWIGDQLPPLALLSLSGSDITRVVYQSGGNFTGSTFFDNVQVVVPAPATLAFAGLAAAFGGRRRRG